MAEKCPDKQADSVSGLHCMSMEVTTHCNLGCRHCFARAGAPPVHMDADLAGIILREGYLNGYRHLHITGGEPMLWGGLFDTLDLALDLGYRSVLINTNGTLLTAGKSRRLAGYQGLAVSVSLDGTRVPHDRLRGPGAYRLAVSGIDAVLSAGIDAIVFTICTRSLLPRLPRFADDLFQRFAGIKYLALIQLINRMSSAALFSEEFIGPDECLVLVQTISLLNRYGKRVILKNNPFAPLAAQRLGIPWTSPVSSSVEMGRLFIKANRDLCVTHSDRWSFGRYMPGMMNRLLDSPGYRSAFNPDRTPCRSCGFYEFCRERGMAPLEKYLDQEPFTPYCSRLLHAADRERPVEEVPSCFADSLSKSFN